MSVTVRMVIVQVTNHDGVLIKFDTIDTVIYLIDFSLAYYLPEVQRSPGGS